LPVDERVAQVCSHGSVRSWSVIVPAKRLAVAKSRLRPFTDNLSDDSLSDDLRVAHDELVLALLADTVAAAVACPAVGSVLVVTDDPAAVDVGRALGARTVADEPGRGLNAALEHGGRLAGDITGEVAGDIAVAALSSDLPALRPEELAAALRAAGAAPRCFVPDAHGTGTTLLTAVGTPLAPHFGPESARAHRSSGAVALSGDWPGLVQDVDTETDLRAALALGTGPRTSTLADRFRTAR
jgi:2-phospho-L-lactate guanylyltransferase